MIIPLSETPVARAYFPAGKTVTIALYDNAGDVIPIDTAACTPSTEDPNIYIWSFDNVTTTPTELLTGYWKMSAAGYPDERGEFYWGGWVQDVDPLSSADTCKVSMNLSNADGNIPFPNELYDPDNENYIQIKSQYYGSSRYFRMDKYKPSFDSLTGTAFWVLPQGATVDIKLKSFDIDESAQTVPSTTTADLYTWLNPA
ncbi:hypothetical protein KKI24_22670 [bacterium]|nr:hypothetical protein [bacterium]